MRFRLRGYCNLSILALDEQPAMLAHLRMKLAMERVQNVTPIEPGALEASTARIDRVLAINVLHEIGGRDLAHITTLLASNGRALFSDWNAGVERPMGPPADHIYGIREASSRLEHFGFAVQHTELFAYHYAILCSYSPSIAVAMNETRRPES